MQRLLAATTVGVFAPAPALSQEANPQAPPMPWPHAGSDVPLHPDYHFGLGLILLDGLGQPEAARRHFESCLQLAPDHPQASEIRDHLPRIDRR